MINAEKIVVYRQERYPIPVYDEITRQDICRDFKYVLYNRRPKKFILRVRLALRDLVMMHFGHLQERRCECVDGDCSTDNCWCYERSTIRIKVRLLVYICLNA